MGEWHQDVQQEFNQEREFLLEDIRKITRDIKLKNLVLDSYIPPEELEKISRRAVFEEAEEIWTIDRLQYAGTGMCAAYTVNVHHLCKSRLREA